MSDEVLAIIARVSGSEPLRLEPETELVADLGMNSLQAFELVIELEEALGIQLGEGDIEAIRTVDDVLRAVRQAGPCQDERPG